MKYTVQGVRVYEGFMPFNAPKSLTEHPDAKLIVAWFDGEPDLWLVTDRSQLVKLYEEDWGVGCCEPGGRVIMQEFKR